MAHISYRDGPRGRSWFFVVYVPDRLLGGMKQLWERGFRTKKTAERAAREIEVDVAKGTYQEPLTIKLKDYIWEWFHDNKSGWAQSTVNNYEVVIKNHIVPDLGHFMLDELRKRHVKNWVKKMIKEGGRSGKGASKGTVQGRVAVLSSALREAEEDELIERNPARGVTVPETEKSERVVIDSEMAKKIIVEAEGSIYYMPINLAFNTGMRLGEVAGLRCSRVNLAGGYLRVDWQRVATGGKIIEKIPKRSRSRDITLADDIIGQLEVHLEDQLEQLGALGKTFSPDGYIFLNAEGEPMKPKALARNFQKIAEAAGCSGVTFHGIRHSHASMLAADKVEPKVIQERLGHAQISTTFDIYVDAYEEGAYEAAQVIEERLRY